MSTHELKQQGFILCSDCQSKGFRQILGKLREDGSLYILRNKQGTTIITASQYNLLCGCGYTITITQGVISKRAGQAYKYTPVQ